MGTCSVCGGSGVQRVSSQRLRTCLACLGQGNLEELLVPDRALIPQLHHHSRHSTREQFICVNQTHR